MRIRDEKVFAFVIDKEIVTKKVKFKRHLPPDVSACIAWLKRMNPAFRDDPVALDVTVEAGDEALAKLLGIARGAKR